MNAILAIAALIAAVTAREIVQAVADHVKVKDNIRVLEAQKEKNESTVMATARAKLWAESEKEEAEVKLELANKITDMTSEQLAAYNRTLDEASRLAVQYIPAPYLPAYYGNMQWRGW